MKNPTKGVLTRQKIMERANALFNESGVDHTISKIAASMGMGKSRVTNYFPKKEHLVLALLKQYEEEMAGVFEQHHTREDFTDFRQYVQFLSAGMDLMFQYRGVIAHALTNRALNSSVGLHIEENYARNKARLLERHTSFFRNGLVSETLLEPENFEVFSFHFFTMASNWIISYNLLDPGKPYPLVKPRYLRSILCCLQPYLTELGHASLEATLSEYHCQKLH